MSFGWSTGDIALALQILYKVGSALKDAGGASSAYREASTFLQSLQRTLEHLRVFSSTTIDQSRTLELQRQVSEIRVPVKAFVEEIQKYEITLGGSSSKGRLRSAPRKVQWALRMQGRLKKLQDQVTAPLVTLNLLLGLNVLTIVSNIQNELPLHIRNEILSAVQENLPSLIQSGLQPWTRALRQYQTELQESQMRSTHLILQHMGENKESLLGNVVEQDEIRNGAVQGLQRTMTSIGARIEDIVSRQGVQKRYQIDRFTSSISSYQQQMSDIRHTVSNLPSSHLNSTLSFPSSVDTETRMKLEELSKHLRICALLLVASIQALTRQLFLILTPHLIAILKIGRRLQHRLLLPGDHFIFEDATGHLHRLPTLQFQQWDVFDEYLKASFKGLPGHSHVLSQQFLILNAYSGVTIDPKTWNAVVQPNFRANMAILLNGAALTGDRCPHCRAKIQKLPRQLSMKCKLCCKFVTLVQANDTPEHCYQYIPPEISLRQNERNDKTKISSSAMEARPVETARDIMISANVNFGNSLSYRFRYPSSAELNRSIFKYLYSYREDMKAFKRVAWRPGEFKDLTVLYEPPADVPDLDVIAIHSLDGHAWKSFTSPFDQNDLQTKEINWLEDILPYFLDDVGVTARIMTFGYDVDTWIRRPPRDMGMPSNDLLNSLETERSARIVDPHRPVLFIGHGLGTHIARDAIMFMYPRVVTGLVTIVETDDVQPLSLEIDSGLEWMYPGMKKQDVASFYAKKLEISLLADKFDALRSRARPPIPFHQYARYQPRPGFERQLLTPEMMSAKMYKTSYIDLAKYTTETKDHFGEHFLRPIGKMAVSIKTIMVHGKEKLDD